METVGNGCKESRTVVGELPGREMGRTWGVKGEGLP